MEYILFAFLAMIASGCNAIFNKFASVKISSAVSSVIKSAFMVIACFIISVCFGHLENLYNLSQEQWIFIIVNGVLTTIDWIFYFAAMKRSNLEAFTPFNETAQLLFGNVMFIIFLFDVVTKNGTILNVILYIAGLIVLFSALLFITFSKKMNPKNNGKVNYKWVFFAIIAALGYASTLLVMKLKLTEVPADVISYHQMVIVLAISIVVMLIKREWKDFKNMNFKGYAIFFVAAIFNTLLMIFRYQALSYTECIPSLVNVIIGLEFILVAVVTIFFKKTDDKLATLIVIILVSSGMVLNLLSGIL